MKKRNLCKTSDSLTTARAVVAIEIDVPKFGTSKSTVCFTDISKILIKLCANLEPD